MWQQEHFWLDNEKIGINKESLTVSIIPGFQISNALQINVQSVVNFTNILQAAFAPIFFCQKIVSTEKLGKTLLNKKATRKMLVKVKLGILKADKKGNLANILLVHFCQIFLHFRNVRQIFGHQIESMRTPYGQFSSNAVQCVVGRNGDVVPEVDRTLNGFAQITENVWIATLFVNGVCFFVKFCHLESISPTFLYYGTIQTV